MLRDTDKRLNCVITVKKVGYQKDVVFGYGLPSLTMGGGVLNHIQQDDRTPYMEDQYIIESPNARNNETKNKNERERRTTITETERETRGNKNKYRQKKDRYNTGI